MLAARVDARVLGTAELVEGVAEHASCAAAQGGAPVTSQLRAVAITLTPEQLDELAERIAEKLRPRPAKPRRKPTDKAHAEIATKLRRLGYDRKP